MRPVRQRLKWSANNTEEYLRIDKIIPGLRREQDYSVDEKSRTGSDEAGITAVENRLNVENLYMPDNIQLLHHVNQGLRSIRSFAVMWIT